ncbi:RRP12-like protein [Chionoecetes opilio]|uniref:RRP12-like protein n=1 Tax=Chionoecetes opilio TaxID=41210 RepID=A0A8J5CIA5_CHIOP|nr:RRP12-like protein [Chionoecetes opilio]
MALIYKPKTVCECLLSLMQVGRVLVNTNALQALHALFSAHPPPHTLPPATNAALLNALTGGVAVPGKNDPQPAGVWITVVTVGVMNMFKLDEEAGMTQLQAWMTLLVPYWQE